MTEMDDGEFLHALSLRGYLLIVTEGVVTEVKKEPGLSRLRLAIKEKWIIVQATSRSEYELFKNHFPMLDYAEVEVIQKGLEYKSSQIEYICVLDEGPGRKIANQLCLNKIGTEGLLNRLNHIGVLDASLKEKLLNKLRQSSFRCLKA